MKNVTIQRQGKWDHIIGGGINETYSCNNDKDVSIFIGHIINNMNVEDYQEHEQDIDNIYNLVNGEYYLNDGDHNITITITDFA